MTWLNNNNTNNMRGVSQGAVNTGSIQICQNLNTNVIPYQLSEAQNLEYGGASIYTQEA